VMSPMYAMPRHSMPAANQSAFLNLSMIRYLPIDTKANQCFNVGSIEE
jgi:hypothetical protein